MMLGNALSLQAAGLTRQQMGLQGVYKRTRRRAKPREFSVTRQSRNLGAVDTEALKTIGINASAAFIASGGDVDELYEPAFAAINVLTLALPQPFQVLVSLGVSAAKIGIDAVRGLIKVTMRAAGQYLPLSVSEKVIENIVRQNTLDWWQRAARDKFAEGAGDSLAVSLGLAAFNASVSADNRLDLKVRTRVADRVYALARQYGATDWQAAMVAVKVCQNTGATQAKYQYAAIVGDVNNPEAAWKAKMTNSGGKKVDADAAKKALEDAEKAKAKEPSPWLIGAGAVAALTLLSR